MPGNERTKETKGKKNGKENNLYPTEKGGYPFRLRPAMQCQSARTGAKQAKEDANRTPPIPSPEPRSFQRPSTQPVSQQHHSPLALPPYHPKS